jgi:hypothetical protein
MEIRNLIWSTICDNGCLGHKTTNPVQPNEPEDCPFCGLPRHWIAIDEKS